MFKREKKHAKITLNNVCGYASKKLSIMGHAWPIEKTGCSAVSVNIKQAERSRTVL